MTNVIHWFRQDLRLVNNPALFHAAKAGTVLPIYILDDENSKNHQMGAASRVWLYYSLNKLNESLDGNLAVYKGNAKNIINDIINKQQIKAIYWNRCYEPWRTKRDTSIKENLKQQNITVHSFNGSLLWEPWEILKNDGLPYKVFTHFYKNAYAKGLSPTNKLLAKPDNLNLLVLKEKNSIDSLNLLPNLAWSKEIIANWQVGETAAKEKLAEFLQDKVQDYKEGRNYPAKKRVSCLSPYLHFGEISPLQIWVATSKIIADQNLDCFLSEIGWREFSYYLLYHFPTLTEQNLQAKFDQFPWLKIDDNNCLENLTKWQQGLTGYPIVDAGMRELWQTGYMHNRVRMIVASFLVKNLLIHWHYGRDWFWDCLVDADLANNSASWQWVAGCGTDAAPYFRIFNPLTQGEKFDPDGKYTKHYVPELKNMPDKYLFQPFAAPDHILAQAGVKLGINYPKPIIDLKISREKALAAYTHSK
ncbi:MAG: deoxyribodipyrimidine photo-lyase [Rickettsiaceae bacterium]|nr:deoxyribodipyrimidine photo-lyase [Rickettsiaceae bacterium]